MSVFGDATDDILGDDLNEAIINDDLPSDAEDDRDAGDDEEKNPVKVEPKRRTTRNPRPRLTVETLTGKRGLHTVEDYFKNIKFAGKGYEKKDLNEVMRRLQHWAHRMYPNYNFDDVLANIERLGKKKQLHVHMNRYRQGLLEGELLQPHSDDEENLNEAPNDEPLDEFDALLGEQIALSKLAPRTPAHQTSFSTSSIITAKFTEMDTTASTPLPPHSIIQPEEPGEAPAVVPAPAPLRTESKLTAEQIAKIAENRRLAQERLKARREAKNTQN